MFYSDTLCYSYRAIKFTLFLPNAQYTKMVNSRRSIGG